MLRHRAQRERLRRGRGVVARLDCFKERRPLRGSRSPVVLQDRERLAGDGREHVHRVATLVADEEASVGGGEAFSKREQQLTA